jgi:hypothetical protein
VVDRVYRGFIIALAAEMLPSVKSEAAQLRLGSALYPPTGYSRDRASPAAQRNLKLRLGSGRRDRRKATAEPWHPNEPLRENGVSDREFPRSSPPR